MARRTALRAIVFDMDGTLLDSYGRVVDAFVRTMRSLGGDGHPQEEIVAALVGPAGSILTHLLGRAATDEDVAVYHGHLAELAPAAPVYPGIEAALGALSRPAAVFTGASLRSATILLSASGLNRHFEAVVGGDQVDRVKPAPDGLLRASRLLGVPPEEVAYVGDSPNDLACARAAGSLAVAAGWGELFDPSADADVVLSDPLELLGLVG